MQTKHRKKKYLKKWSAGLLLLLFCLGLLLHCSNHWFLIPVVNKYIIVLPVSQWGFGSNVPPPGVFDVRGIRCGMIMVVG